MAPGEFRIGDAIRRSLSIFGQHWRRFLLVTGIAAIPYLGIYWFEGSLVHDLRHQMMQAPDVALMQQSRSAGGLANLFSLLGAILTVIAQAAIFHNAFAIMAGRDVGMRESVRAGTARFWPMIGLGIILALGLMFGFALLVVPGFMLLTMWFAAFPACVVEKLGPIRSLNRSAALTKGNRWKLLGLIVLLLIAAMIVGGVTVGVLVMIGGIGFAVGQYALHAVSTAFTAIVTVVVYHDLRVAKEGADPATIAMVFN